MLCAGGEGSGTNKVKYNCTFKKVSWRNLDLFRQGDSGGPLTVEEDGVHTLAGVTSHGLSETPQIKVRKNQQNVFVQIFFQRTSLTCTPASPTSCPGSTPPSSPTEDSPPVTILSLLCLFKVTTISLDPLWSGFISVDWSNCKSKYFRKLWTASWEALGSGGNRWIGRCMGNFLCRDDRLWQLLRARSSGDSLSPRKLHDKLGYVGSLRRLLVWKTGFLGLPCS